MKLTSIFILSLLLLLASCHRRTVASSSPLAQQYTDARGNVNLLGKSSRQQLEQAPYDAWFKQYYTGYTLDSATLTTLSPLLQQKRFVIFMGTWCGDSRREVPRMYKLLDYCGIKASQVELINVSNADTLYKQSPAHEEKGLNIHRVPDLLVYDGNKELGRIVEMPVTSLEQDLLAIVSGQAYEPQYKGVTYLHRLFASTPPAGVEKDLEQTALQLKPIVQKAGELNSYGYVLMSSGQLNEALVVYRLNTLLFPLVPDTYSSLADALIKKGQYHAAKISCEKALELEPGNQRAVAIMARLAHP